MSNIYAISDIHGCYEEMVEALSLVDLHANKDNKLILLGDYVNRGENSYKVLCHIKKLEETYPKQVVVLLGNHDQLFIDWFTEEESMLWFDFDQELMTTRSFFTNEEWDSLVKRNLSFNHSSTEMSDLIKSEMKKNHQELLQWLFSKKESLFYERANQIFVHAGICETDEDLWKYTTEVKEFTWKYPAETGSFYKDIIAGHVSSAEVSADENYLGKVYWDNENHFFIDGETNKSRVIPLLKYNTDTKLYSSYEKNHEGEWMEFPITKSKTR